MNSDEAKNAPRGHVFVVLVASVQVGPINCILHRKSYVYVVSEIGFAVGIMVLASEFWRRRNSKFLEAIAPANLDFRPSEIQVSRGNCL